MSIVYYMPVYVRDKARSTGNALLKQWSDLFKIFNVNSCFLDRTGTFEAPFETTVLFPLPDVGPTLSFDDLCLNRAREFLATGKALHLFYSGGLDSTTMLVAINECILQGYGSYDQVSIAATPESVLENPLAWWSLILKNYRVENSSALVSKLSVSHTYLLGENSDQVFGAALISPPEFVDKPLTLDALSAFLRYVGVTHHDWLLDRFMVLASKSPLPLVTMRDFFWWINFSCKWQSVALRMLTVTNLLKDNKRLLLSDLRIVDSFFNTEDFQKLAMNGTLAKHGDSFSSSEYKKAARDFIHRFQPTWTDYVTHKVKMPSQQTIFWQASQEPLSAIRLDRDGLVSSPEFL